jgi:hypothetical protein
LTLDGLVIQSLCRGDLGKINLALKLHNHANQEPLTSTHRAIVGTLIRIAFGREFLPGGPKDISLLKTELRKLSQLPNWVEIALLGKALLLETDIPKGLIFECLKGINYLTIKAGLYET